MAYRQQPPPPHLASRRLTKLQCSQHRPETSEQISSTWASSLKVSIFVFTRTLLIFGFPKFALNIYLDIDMLVPS